MGSKRVYCLRTLSYKGRRGFAQLLENGGLLMNYLRAKYRLRRGAYRRQRIAKARTLRGMFASGSSSQSYKTLVALSEA